MRRFLVVLALIFVGVLSEGAMWFGCSPAPTEKTATIQKVRDRLYVIEGGGGNTAVLVTDAGVVLVDTKLAGWGPVILEKIRTITDKPVTTIINTHTHGDHVGSNAFFTTAVDIVAHENTKSHMQVQLDFVESDLSGFLPTRTFTNRLSLTSGADRIDLYYFGPAHTDGDVVVVFPAGRIAHVGDLFAAKAPPIIDSVHGGSGVAFPETLLKMYAGIKDVDQLITGHSSLMNWNELERYADFNGQFLAWAADQMHSGRSVEDAAAAYHMPQEFTDYAREPWQVKTNLERIYAELRKPPPATIRWRGGVQ